MKLLIKLILGLGLLGVLVVGTAITILAYLDPNDYKHSIAEQVKQRTGRELNINGNITLSYYPWLGVDIEQLSLSNAPGFGEAPLLQADTIKARARLWPLLRKQLKMDTLVIHGARLNLARDENGVTNWGDLVTPPTEARQTASGRLLPVGALVLGGIDIKDAEIHWQDKQQGLEYRISNAGLNTGALKPGEPVNITAALGVSATRPALSSAIEFAGTVAYEDGGKRLTLKPVALDAVIEGKKIPGGQARLKLSSEIHVDFNQETARVDALNLTAFDTELQGRIEATNIVSGATEVSGAILVNSKDLPQLFKIAELEPLASRLATMKDKSMTLNAGFGVDTGGGNIDLNPFDLKLLGNSIQAEIHAHNIKSDTPAVTATVAAGGSELPGLLIIAAQFSGGNLAENKSLATRLASAPGSFDIETSFAADMKAGTVDVQKLSVQALGMTATGKLKARQVKRKNPSISGELKAAGPDLPLLIQVVGAFQADDGALPGLGRDLSKIKDRKFTISSQFDADLKAGRLAVPLLEFNSLGWAVNGKLKGENVQKKSGSMDGSFTLASKNPKPLLSALGQGDVAGVLQSVDINADISGNLIDLDLKPLQLTAVFSGPAIPNAPVALTVNADTVLDTNAHMLRLDNFSITGLGLDIKGKLTAKDYAENPALSGEIAIAPFDLKTLMRQLNQTLPPTADDRAFNRVALENTAFTGTAKSLDIKRFEAVLDDSRIQGDFKINDLSKSEYEFGVGIDRIDVDRYLPPKATGKPATPETVAVGAATELPLETLRALNLKGDLLIGELIISNAKLNDVHLSLAAGDGDIKLAPVGANLYNGSYSGVISLDASGGEPALTVHTDFSNVDIEPLLTDLTGSANLQGTGNISLALNSKGSDINVLRRTLSGNGSIDFRQGVLKGIDIRGILQQLEVMLESKRPGKLNNGKQTEFDALTATLNINSGIVDNDDLLMLAPGFRVNGDGMLFNLNDETWKYNFIVDVDESTATRGEERYNIGGYKLKIKCRGKIADKKCLPDVESILKALLKNTLGTVIREKIGLPLDILPGSGGAETTERQPPAEEQPTQEPKTPDPAEEVDKLIKGVLDKLF